MDVEGKVIVVTGGASGIGRALARRFAAAGAAVAVADVNERGVRELADELGAVHGLLDVGSDEQVCHFINEVEDTLGPIDLFCSNAGISIAGGVEETSNDDWERIISINLMSHIYAARALVPRMIARGGGYLLNTASAAGLLSQIGSAGYSVTKHAAVAFAEYLAITYGDRGLRVSVLCPQAVRTAMTAGSDNGGVAGVDGMLEPEQVADTVLEAVNEERFLILTHPEVHEYMQRKAGDVDRWLGGMRRLQARYLES